MSSHAELGGWIDQGDVLGPMILAGRKEAAARKSVVFESMERKLHDD